MQTDSVVIPKDLVATFMAEHGLTFDRVATVEDTNRCEPVWDVTIEDKTIPLEHAFLVDGMVTHNSADPNYLSNIMKNMGVKASVENIFGVRDEKTGAWITPPLVRYKSEAIAEKFFDTLAQIQRKLPDKKKIGNSWYYVYNPKVLDPKTKKLKIDKNIVAKVGNFYDKEYFRKTGMYRIPAPDGSLQAVFLVDSYPAMLPESQDVDDPNSAVATQARMFSDQLKRVKGRMKGKRIAVFGINQIRMRPMTMGNPEYEAGGEALRLYSDVRNKHRSCALSAVSKFINETVSGKGQFEAEPSVQYKGEDTYRYIHVRNIKNKYGRPFIETFLRLWTTDPKGAPWGFDPCFDTYIYLRQTGQLSGTRKKMLLKMQGNEATKTIGWLDFKRLILSPTATVKEICAEIGMKPKKIRAECFKQMQSGLGLRLFNEHTLENSATGSKADDTDE